MHHVRVGLVDGVFRLQNCHVPIRPDADNGVVTGHGDRLPGQGDSAQRGIVEVRARRFVESDLPRGCGEQRRDDEGRCYHNEASTKPAVATEGGDRGYQQHQQQAEQCRPGVGERDRRRRRADPNEKACPEPAALRQQGEPNADGDQCDRGRLVHVVEHPLWADDRIVGDQQGAAWMQQAVADGAFRCGLDGDNNRLDRRCDQQR